jgi:hypothetical protein
MLRTQMTGKAYQKESTQLEEHCPTGHQRNKEHLLLSSAEAEYYSLSECAQEALFTQNLLMELAMIKQTAIIYEANLGAIFLTKNQQVSQRKKHIDRKQHFLRELLAKKLLEIKLIKSENNMSDTTNKNTSGVLHEKHTNNIKQHPNFWKEDVQTGETKAQTQLNNYLSRNINFSYKKKDYLKEITEEKIKETSFDRSGVKPILVRIT